MANKKKWDRKPIHDNPKDFVFRARVYLEQAKYPNMHGLGLYLGYAGARGIHAQRARGEMWNDAVDAVYELVTDAVAQKLADKNVSATGTIFHLKQLGWTDKQEVKHEGDMVIKIVNYAGNDTPQL
jgi:hypothetical protein